MQKEDVTAVVWQDKLVNLLLSTNSDHRTDGSVTRKTGKGNEETEIACRQTAINYTKHVGGVDVSDLKIEYCGVGRSSEKWWKFALHFVLNVSCELFQLLRPDISSPLYSTRKLATDLQTKLGVSANWYITSRKRPGRKRTLPIGTSFHNIFHTLQKYQAVQTCVLCV